MKLAISIVAIGLGGILSAAPAQAQSRVFVAAQGADTNPCSFAQPCRTFQQAHNTVAAGGEIDVLDPAGYGALTINKAIIQGHGYAGIAVPSGNGILINAGSSDIVNLRGLLLDGVGSGSEGIVFNTGASLNIQDSLVRNFINEGINFQPNALSTLSVSNTLVSGMNGSGIFVSGNSTPSTVDAALTRVEVNSSAIGISLLSQTSPSVNVSAVDSVVANNSVGISVLAGGASQVYMALRSSNISNNGTGVTAPTAGAIVRLSQSVITGNSTGWTATNGGSVGSTADNLIDDNTNGNGGPPTLAYK
jgi:hypothetical protein